MASVNYSTANCRCTFIITLNLMTSSNQTFWTIDFFLLSLLSISHCALLCDIFSSYFVVGWLPHLNKPMDQNRTDNTKRPTDFSLFSCSKRNHIKHKLNNKFIDTFVGKLLTLQTSISAIAERQRCRVGQTWLKVEDWNWKIIFYRHRSTFNHCGVIGPQSNRIRWGKNAK